jgi:hypothetical protein
MNWTFKLEFGPLPYDAEDKAVEDAAWQLVEETRDKLVAMGLGVSTERKYGAFEAKAAHRTTPVQ